MKKTTTAPVNRRLSRVNKRPQTRAEWIKAFITKYRPALESLAQK